MKLRIEMGKVSKRQQLEQEAENSPMQPMGSQHSDKITPQESTLSKHQNKNVL